ncbi:MAG: 2-oxoacid:acceptor oxidoreductase subunit alpha [Bdellovibrionota bacterium]
MAMKNNFNLTVATVNGSGSQSSNQILARSLFRMGLPVSAKNLFPSNIAGLPTWFTIRVSSEGFTARKKLNDIVVALNPATIEKDIQSLRADGLLITAADAVILNKRADVIHLPIPFKDLSLKATDVAKMRKMLINMIYVGIVAELLEMPENIVNEVVADQFADKPSVIVLNTNAVVLGRDHVRSNNLKSTVLEKFKHRAEAIPSGNNDKILIDGNSASALGLLDGGCTFLAWYPITPSSSVAESFQKYAKQSRTHDKKNNYAVVQAEDELSAINMVIGAGWAGARALTATSGPGLSLMAEAAGLSYFAEIPSVIWNVQRAGPSTGLPTRTMQADLLASYRLSHGDTEHVVLLPGSIEECFEFGQTCFDLAEHLQTLVIVLSDLDLGMNFWISKKLKSGTKPYNRGKVLDAKALNDLESFARYKDVDGDGIPYRTLPGTPHAKAAYFTRGTSHTETSAYSEDNVNFENLLIRLKKKFVTARDIVPKPVIDQVSKAETALISYGSSEPAVQEARHILKSTKPTSHMRIRALPLQPEIREFIESHKEIYVVEQNRDGQLAMILRNEWPDLAIKIKSLTVFDGLPMTAEDILKGFK